MLDVGATSDRSYEHSDYLEAWLPHNQRLTAVGIDDASFLTAARPGLTFVRTLPFKDAALISSTPARCWSASAARKGNDFPPTNLLLWAHKPAAASARPPSRNIPPAWYPYLRNIVSPS
jgi:hypothetical protein